MENITQGILHGIRNWRGNINNSFTAIDNLVNLITAHQPAWPIPADLLQHLTGSHNELRALIVRCRTSEGSKADREHRNTLLKSTVNLCRTRVKVWAQESYFTGLLTEDDVHQLGFLLPGEAGGHRARTEATGALAEVKVRAVNGDFIRVTLDNSAGESAARVAHGWPPGVRQALIVILADNGKTETLRLLTTRLHNTIHMPKGSRGKQFIIKAAFLKHINDDPLFGAEQTFSMPLSTEDLMTALSRQHQGEMDATLQELERLRREIELLKARKNEG